ncbi:helix-hairpin-helix domain-containing protein [Coleofasciculus sp. FACHB-T130]|nr:phospholipase D-like domain-containing protein [Coleofasciculus sp. FACHB-T130]MBD1882019.1 helix-hairpin-helix domain-containing protein [Coleofasciculus sp. FACHB-T130]
MALTLGACQRVQSQNSRLTPLPQDPFVQVYFNHAQTAEYTEPYRQQRRQGDDLEQQIVDAIASAKSSVDVAVQELRLPKIAQALVDRKKAGVKVRVILENTYSRPLSAIASAELAKLPQREQQRYQEFLKLVDRNGDNQLSPAEINQGDALVMLHNAGIPTIDDTADGSKGSSLMHHKFVIVDNAKLIVTSANFTTSDIHGDFAKPSSLGNANNLLKIDSPELATLFTQEFNVMWGDGPGGNPDSKFGIKKPYRPPQQVKLVNTTVTVQFSPTSTTQPWNQTSNGLIGKTLSTAAQSVDMALFVFSDQHLVNILETDHQNGVQVRALIDPDFVYRPYSEALDMMGLALGNQCKYEADNRPWQEPITTVGVPVLPKGDLLHHKFGVVDKKNVITGSHNWSEAANSGNDETVLVIESPTVAAHYEREFDRLYKNAVLGVPDGIGQKIQAQQKQCSQQTTASQPSQTTPTANPKAKLPIQKAQPPKSLSNSPQSSIPSPKSGPYLVNLNTATQEEIEALPGVGPKLAQRIIEARQQKSFTSLQDLDKVPGVGPSLLEKLSDRVTW